MVFDVIYDIYLPVAVIVAIFGAIYAGYLEDVEIFGITLVVALLWPLLAPLLVVVGVFSLFYGAGKWIRTKVKS